MFKNVQQIIPKIRMSGSKSILINQAQESVPKGSKKLFYCNTSMKKKNKEIPLNHCSRQRITMCCSKYIFKKKNVFNFFFSRMEGKVNIEIVEITGTNTSHTDQQHLQSVCSTSSTTQCVLLPCVGSSLTPFVVVGRKPGISIS